jgi:VIT1/CCC1 family predicted Fe2+/Mn2+ transporter
VQRTHRRSAARELDRRDGDEEASVAWQARAAATVAAMHDAELAAVASERATEEESRKHYAAKLNTALVRHEDERLTRAGTTSTARLHATPPLRHHETPLGRSHLGSMGGHRPSAGRSRHPWASVLAASLLFYVRLNSEHFIN